VRRTLPANGGGARSAISTNELDIDAFECNVAIAGCGHSGNEHMVRLSA
jgi:hypothetical protein